MNHPTKQEWISYLYDEISAEKKSEMKAHLRTCAACQAHVTGSQRVKADLDAWHLPVGPKRNILLSPGLKLAAAALFMICTAFAVGRFTAPKPSIEALRAALEPQLRESFQQQLTAAREADRKSFIAMLRDVEEQRLSDYTQLRNDLETVAVVADEKLTTTQQAVSQLHLYAQSEPTKEPSIK